VNPVLRHAAAHVVVDSLDAPVLSSADLHHLARVLRIRASDMVTVTDGIGRWREVRFDHGALVPVGPVCVADPAPRVGTTALTIGCAIPKGDRPEWVVQKLTELGLDRIILFETARSVVRWDARKRLTQVERLRRVAREAAQQSRRLVLPVVDVLTWGDAVALPAVALAEPGAPLGWWRVGDGPSTDRVRSVLVGPEGGFTDEELAACPRRVGLSVGVLRVETAALAAGVLLTARGDHPSPPLVS